MKLEALFAIALLLQSAATVQMRCDKPISVRFSAVYGTVDAPDSELVDVTRDVRVLISSGGRKIRSRGEKIGVPRSAERWAAIVEFRFHEDVVTFGGLKLSPEAMRQRWRLTILDLPPENPANSQCSGHIRRFVLGFVPDSGLGVHTQRDLCISPHQQAGGTSQNLRPDYKPNDSPLR